MTTLSLSLAAGIIALAAALRAARTTRAAAPVPVRATGRRRLRGA